MMKFEEDETSGIFFRQCRDCEKMITTVPVIRAKGGCGESGYRTRLAFSP
jgi:hypothetical protein